MTSREMVIKRFKSLIYQAVKQNNISLPASLEDIMNRWILQMGFPVVTIDTKTGSISQKHFLLDKNAQVTTQSPFK